ncbi:MAG: cupin domain-containing protein [Pseudomonadota bacterium]
MKIMRSGERPSRRAPEAYFTGTVWQNPIANAESPSRAVSILVSFEPGARTNWHTHPLGQTLHVLSGVGWYQSEGEARIDIRPGDTVWISPGEKHWHGATSDNTMTHLVIQENDDSGTHATWMEPVSDADYLGQ